MPRRLPLCLLTAFLAMTAPYRSPAETPATRPADGGRRQKAVELLAKAESFRSLQSDRTSIGTFLVEAYAELGQLDEAQKRLDSIADERSKIQPIVQIIKARKKAGDGADAKSLAATIKEPGDSSLITLVDYVAVQASAGNFKTAENAIDLPKKGFVSKEKLEALIELASEEYRGGKKPEAVWHFTLAAAVIRLNQNPADLDPFTLGFLAMTQNETGDRAGAAEVLESDSDAEDKLNASVEIAVADYTPSDRDRTTGLLGRLSESLASKKGAEEYPQDTFAAAGRLTHLCLLAEGWAKSGDRDQSQAAQQSALSLADRMAVMGGGYRPEWPLLVAGQMASDGDRAGAMKVVERAIGKATALPKEEAASALWDVAMTEADTDLADDAPRVIALALKDGSLNADLEIMPSVALAARGIANRVGIAADLSWIESLPTDEAKAAAYAGAAAGMADQSPPEH